MDGSKMLIDEFMPEFDVNLVVHEVVDATPEETHRALESLDLLDDRIVRTLVTARDLPRRTLNRLRGSHEVVQQGPIRFRDLLGLEGDSALGWVALGEERGTELLAGLVGEFWHRDYGIVKMRASEFVAYREPGKVKTVADLSLRAYGDRRTLLSYESRTVSTDDQARTTFGRYWAVLRPFVHVLMRRTVLGIKREAEGLHGAAGSEPDGVRAA